MEDAFVFPVDRCRGGTVDRLSWEEIRSRAEAEGAAAATPEALESVRVHYLGRQGVITRAFRALANVDAADRPAAGAALNELKAAVEALLQARAEALAAEDRRAHLAAEALDVTMPGRHMATGRIHVL